jgi:predicted alpha/beta-hydrolase family hydrolase
MEAWAERLAAVGDVVRFDYPYMRAGKKLPNPLPVLLEAHREALAAARSRGQPVVLVGKSMGSRVGCHLAREEVVRGVICFGYPLRAPSGALRDVAVRELPIPALFLQGTRDPLAPLSSLRSVLAECPVKHELVVIQGADHGLAVRKAEQQAVDDALLAAIAAYVAHS